MQKMSSALPRRFAEPVHERAAIQLAQRDGGHGGGEICGRHGQRRLHFVEHARLTALYRKIGNGRRRCLSDDVDIFRGYAVQGQARALCLFGKNREVEHAGGQIRAGGARVAAVDSVERQAR